MSAARAEYLAWRRQAGRCAASAPEIVLPLATELELVGRPWAAAVVLGRVCLPAWPVRPQTEELRVCARMELRCLGAVSRRLHGLCRGDRGDMIPGPAARRHEAIAVTMRQRLRWALDDAHDKARRAADERLRAEALAGTWLVGPECLTGYWAQDAIRAILAGWGGQVMVASLAGQRLERRAAPSRDRVRVVRANRGSSRLERSAEAVGLCVELVRVRLVEGRDGALLLEAL